MTDGPGQFSGRLFGSVRLGELIGSGGMGEVYEGFHEVMEIEVAVKVILPGHGADEKFVKRFIREAQACAMLSHPNLLRIYTAERHESIYYIVMELVKGTDLREVLKATGKIPWEKTLPIIEGACDGLGYAHKKEITHRDIKPDNLLMSTTGEIKIADFGLATASVELQAVTGTGQLLGTPLYMSPEQCDGEAVDWRADIYSLGATWYHLIAGRPPYVGDSPAAVIAQHLVKDVEFPRKYFDGVPKRLLRLIAGMMRRDREKRIQHLAEVKDGLEEKFHASVSQRRESVKEVYDATRKLGLADLRKIKGPGGSEPQMLPHIYQEALPTRDDLDLSELSDDSTGLGNVPGLERATASQSTSVHELPTLPAGLSASDAAGGGDPNVPWGPSSSSGDGDSPLSASGGQSLAQSMERPSNSTAKVQQKPISKVDLRAASDTSKVFHSAAAALDEGHMTRTGDNPNKTLTAVLVIGVAIALAVSAFLFLPGLLEPGPAPNNRPRSGSGGNATRDEVPWIYFSRQLLPDSDAEVDIWRVRADGKALEQLTDLPGAERFPSISPDGETLAFLHQVPDGPMQLMTRQMADGRTVNRTQGTALAGRVRGPVRWSPEGKWLHVVRDSDGAFCKLPASAGSGYDAFPVRVNMHGFDIQSDGKKMVVDHLLHDGSSVLYSADYPEADPASLHPLRVQEGDNPRRPRFSPDNRLILFVGAGEADFAQGFVRLMIANRTGFGRRRFVFDSGVLAAGHPAWVDDTRVAFAGYNPETAKWNLYIVPVPKGPDDPFVESIVFEEDWRVLEIDVFRGTPKE